jgi:hypothetical protein
MPNERSAHQPADWQEAPLKTLIALEIHHALGALNASPALMTIIARWMLLDNDITTLISLKEFNADANNDRNLSKEEGDRRG